jgi:hypothetical protein
MKRNRVDEIHYYEWRLTAWMGSETRDRLDAAGRGIYRELLDACYAQGSFPDDPAWICRRCACSCQEFDQVWPLIKRHFKPIGDTKNPRRYSVVATMFRKRYLDFVKSQIAKSHRASEMRTSGSSMDAPGAHPNTDRTEQNTTEQNRTPTAKRARTPTSGKTSQKFDPWWSAYPLKQYQEEASIAWVSVVSIDNEKAVFDCTARYLESDQVSRAIVMRPDKWLYEQSRNGWAGDWPKRQSNKQDKADEIFRDLMEDHIGKNNEKRLG